ncbi:hypothetical protein SKAU_G00137150 [Synaphobranchus kaupii]|uniref:E3 ubiquitin protein ligase n=1 Tax=Synaphobranchus kaupii TaxID=118154 RepID=A0A9Q1FRT7_SYNKA|nr:hypothetical protein SKAU_G00137150 [Synaphobranchus kaupii]
MHWLPPIQRRPVQRLPVAARMITASMHQYLERVEKERAGNAERQRRAALKRQREMERAAFEKTIEAVIAGVGTTTSDSGNTISPSPVLCLHHCLHLQDTTFSEGTSFGSGGMMSGTGGGKRASGLGGDSPPGPPEKKGKKEEKTTTTLIEPIRIGGVSSTEEMDMKVLQFKNKKLCERLEQRQAMEDELRERIEKLEKRQATDDTTLLIVNRYWSQLDENVQVLLHRFEPEEAQPADPTPCPEESESGQLHPEPAEEEKALQVQQSVQSIVDPLQFAYQQNRGVDALRTLLHLVKSHLNTPKSYIRLVFVDFSSAFNTIQPHLMAKKLLKMNLNPHLILWDS